MLRLILTSALAVWIGGVAEAKPHTPSLRIHRAPSSGDADFTSHRYYRNVSGHAVHSPTRTTSGGRPAGATARCGDGSWSFSEHHRGTCSHHGGVSSWL